MKNKLIDFEGAVRAINEDRRLIISADESFLTKLPKGRWIGGTSPYSMSKGGGAYHTGQAYVQELPNYVSESRSKIYDKDDIQNVYRDGFESGFSVILLPALSDILVKFALEVPSFPLFGRKPLMGWVTGAKLDELGKTPAKVYDGSTGTFASDKGVVMHIELPQTRYADIGIINIFDISDQGDQLKFESDNLEVKDVWVNGIKVNFADYLLKNKVDIRWPLVGDYNGATVNSSFMSVDEDKKTVNLLAPVFRGINYRLAKPKGNYLDFLENFRRNMPNLPQEKVAVTCNCIFNYLYGDLDGKNLDELNGPFVFGEIAYQLLNQTLVYLTIENK